MRSRLAVLFLSLFAVAALQAGSAPQKYDGHWTLDVARSKDLPPFYANVVSHKLTIQQSNESLNVAVLITPKDRDPEPFDLRYSLDGKDTQTESTIRTPAGMQKVPTILNARFADDGRAQISITRELPMRGSEERLKGVVLEQWDLQADGKTLIIHRQDDGPRGKSSSEMVFVRD
jgi:hypothetical protein